MTPRSPASACASSTTAPAPSPNSTQVPRSSQSMMRENVSAPITSARLGLAADEKIVRRRQREDEPRAHRLQVERRALIDAKRGLHARRGRGKGEIGRRGRDDDEIDVLRLAARRVERWREAAMARSEVFSSSAAMWRWRMPVRSTIHSSLVSTCLASSALRQHARRANTRRRPAALSASPSAGVPGLRRRRGAARASRARLCAISSR